MSTHVLAFYTQPHLKIVFFIWNDCMALNFSSQIHIKKLLVMCNFEHFEHCLIASFKLDSKLSPGVVWDGASVPKHEKFIFALLVCV